MRGARGDGDAAAGNQVLAKGERNGVRTGRYARKGEQAVRGRDVRERQLVDDDAHARNAGSVGPEHTPLQSADSLLSASGACR